MATVEYTKRKLMTGAGDIYTQEMTTVDDPNTAPVYGDIVNQTPSLDKVGIALQIAEKMVHLSNKPHSPIKKLKLAEISLDAGYLAAGFEEKMSGYVELAKGIYAIVENIGNNYFRLAIPFTNEAGEEVIWNFPKCELKPSDVSGETERDDFQEQLKSYIINALPLEYETDLKQDSLINSNGVAFFADLSIPEVRETYDRKKLLEQGFYDKASLEKCKSSTVVPGE
ncbi:hypothetical protein ACQV2T_06745 [Facklamia sp. P13069]|uniref:hypothetical protein n=1 Tax=Facklamia sp. P13069 TaxID=3421954 RepID=UPI003D162E88